MPRYSHDIPLDYFRVSPSIFKQNPYIIGYIPVIHSLFHNMYVYVYIYIYTRFYVLTTGKVCFYLFGVTVCIVNIYHYISLYTRWCQWCPIVSKVGAHNSVTTPVALGFIEE